VTENAGMLL